MIIFKYEWNGKSHHVCYNLAFVRITSKFFVNSQNKNIRNYKPEHQACPSQRINSQITGFNLKM